MAQFGGSFGDGFFDIIDVELRGRCELVEKLLGASACPRIRPLSLTI